MANTYKDASGTTAYFKTVEGDGTSDGSGYVNQIGTHLDDAAFTAADPLVAIGGLYQTTIDEVDAGDVGIPRMTARRAQLAAPTWQLVGASGGSVASAGDMEHSTTISSGYNAVTTADLSGATISSTTFYLRVPMGIAGFTKASIGLYHTLDVTVAFSIYAWMSDIYNINAERGLVWTASLAATTALSLLPINTGDLDASAAATIDTMGVASYVPMKYLIIEANPTGTASSGIVYATITRSV
jgi:hypothetical protein